MSQKHARKARRIIRAFEQSDPIFENTDSLHDLKLKRELMKMMLEDHMTQLQEVLPADQLENMTYRWIDDEGNEWETTS